MSPKFDPSPTSGEAVVPEYYQHPDVGYLSYDPNTLVINATREGQRPIGHPIKLTGQFVGTKQPHVQTCSEPREGNRGCDKWAGCPFKKFPYVGPGNVIMRKLGTVSAATCYHYYETTRGGRPTSQLHYGMEGWKLDTTRTTIDVLGSTPVTNPLGQTVSVKKGIWQMEIGDLLPPWWPLMKKKGLPLPPSAELYPELTEDEPKEAPKPKKRGRPKKQAE